MKKLLLTGILAGMINSNVQAGEIELDMVKMGACLDENRASMMGDWSDKTGKFLQRRVVNYLFKLNISEDKLQGFLDGSEAAFYSRNPNLNRVSITKEELDNCYKMGAMKINK